MTIRRDMIEAAGRAKNLLGESGELVVEFIRGQGNTDGGFRGRGAESDIYYTVFGLESLLAMGEVLPVDAVVEYLRGWGVGEGLDLVHLACLVRCWSVLPEGLWEGEVRKEMGVRLAGFRSEDGGFRVDADGGSSSVYGCFMGLGAYQDLGMELPNVKGLIEAVNALKTPEGGYANQRGMKVGLTPATAAAATILQQLGAPVEGSLGEWLLGQRHEEGGFPAMAAASIADLLSTATALHALASLKVDLEGLKESCLNFLDSLWNSRGGFCGHSLDDTIDCEYTFYGLLALGHLSE